MIKNDHNSYIALIPKPGKLIARLANIYLFATCRINKTMQPIRSHQVNLTVPR
jgi:hypothetical protein